MSVGAWRATRAKVRVDLVWIDHSDPSCLPTTLRGLIRWPAFVIGFHGSLGQWLYLWTWLVRVTASFRDDVVPLGSTPGSSSFFFGFSCFPFFLVLIGWAMKGGRVVERLGSLLPFFQSFWWWRWAIISGRAQKATKKIKLPMLADTSLFKNEWWIGASSAAVPTGPSTNWSEMHRNQLSKEKGKMIDGAEDKFFAKHFRRGESQAALIWESVPFECWREATSFCPFSLQNVLDVEIMEGGENKNSLRF